ncbi:MAG: hypothetical protein LT106_15575 [Burkholderiaceae bacterium]|nr:hypothetical protein [Burkholderiaceae bacterium]
MYEIWLAVNIAWEIVVAHTAWTVPLAIVFVGLVVHALARRGNWRAGWRWAWKSALFAGVAAAIVLPPWSGAAWSDLAYVVDWILLVVLAAAVAAVVGAIVWPLAAAVLAGGASTRGASLRATG